jgi:hypothetical protein
VPQGSVLGPVLFILFINAIVSIAPAGTKLKLFADDLKLYSEIHSSDDNIKLQSAIDSLSEWYSTWQLEVNCSKTVVVHLYRNNQNCIYYFNGSPLRSAFELKDLGVNIDSDLSFDRHISNLIGKAYSRIGLLFRGFVSRNLSLLKRAYICYVRPILEYATQVWSPYLLKHINSIEAVQRHFTKRIKALAEYSYAERLAKLNLETLELRRLKADLTLCYKILNGLSPWQPDLYFNQTISAVNTRSRTEKLSQPLCRTNLFKNDYFNRVIPCWNSLPQYVINADSLCSFKRSLSICNLELFLQYSMS